MELFLHNENKFFKNYYKYPDKLFKGMIKHEMNKKDKKNKVNIKQDQTIKAHMKKI